MRNHVGALVGTDDVGDLVLELLTGSLAPTKYAPDSHDGKPLLELINKMWNTKCVPKRWCSSAVVSILKEGDVIVIHSSRGILVIGVVIKLLMPVA
jgi:hypothetical protein